jgi:hypothetical protein
MPISMRKRLAALEAVQRAQTGTAARLSFEPPGLSTLERDAWHAEQVAIAAREGARLIVVRFVSPKPYPPRSERAPVMQ